MWSGWLCNSVVTLLRKSKFSSLLASPLYPGTTISRVLWFIDVSLTPFDWNFDGEHTAQVNVVLYIAGFEMTLA